MPAVREREGPTLAPARYLSTHPPAGDRLQVRAALAAQRARPPVKLLADDDWEEIKKICAK